jgi:hypothetical protein
MEENGMAEMRNKEMEKERNTYMENRTQRAEKRHVEITAPKLPGK